MVGLSPFTCCIWLGFSSTSVPSTPGSAWSAVTDEMPQKPSTTTFDFNLPGPPSLSSASNNNLSDFSPDISLQELESLPAKTDGPDLELLQSFMIEQSKRSLKNQAFLDNHLTEAFLSMYDVKTMPASPPQTKNLSHQSISGKESQNSQQWPTFDNQHYLKSQSMTSTYTQPGNFSQYAKTQPYPQDSFDKAELPKFPPEVPPPLAFPPSRNLNLKAESINSTRRSDMKSQSTSNQDKMLHAGISTCNQGLHPTEMGDRKSILQPIHVNTHNALGYTSSTSGQNTPVSHPGNSYQVLDKYGVSPVTSAQRVVVSKSQLRPQVSGLYDIADQHEWKSFAFLSNFNLIKHKVAIRCNQNWQQFVVDFAGSFSVTCLLPIGLNYG